MVNKGLFAGAVKICSRGIRFSHWIAIAILAAFTTLGIQPAQAQAPSSDTWKSVAIIGGSTAAGAYIGHRVAGPTGTWVGAGLGAATGYAIDRRRRQNEYYNGPYADNGYNPGPYDNAGPYYGNGGPYGPPPNGGAYPYPQQPYPGNYLTRRGH